MRSKPTYTEYEALGAKLVAAENALRAAKNSAHDVAAQDRPPAGIASDYDTRLERISTELREVIAAFGHYYRNQIGAAEIPAGKPNYPVPFDRTR